MFKFLIILFSIGQVFSYDVKLKGGLIYNQEGTAQVNQDYIQYTRVVDTTALFNIAQRLKDCTTLYTTFCTQAEEFTLRLSNTAHNTQQPLEQYFITPLKYPLNEAEGVCKRLNSHLVEVRDIKSYNLVRSFASENNITRIAAGVKYDTQNNVFIFMSDGKNAKLNTPFHSLQYGGSYLGKNHEATEWEKDKYAPIEAKQFPIIYRYPKNNFVIRIADSGDRTYPEHIMCERVLNSNPINYTQESNMMSQLAVHACKRDVTSVVSNTVFTLTEITQITTLNFTAKEQEPDWQSFFPKFEPTIKRKKRYIGFPIYVLLNRLVGCKTCFYETTTQAPQINNISDIKPIQESVNEFLQSDLSNPISYEDFIIHLRSNPKTIPDFVIALHSFYLVQREHQFHNMTFIDWMIQQAIREPIYSFLKYMPMISRVQRDLNSKIRIYRSHMESFKLESNFQNLTTLNLLIEEIDNLTKVEKDLEFMKATYYQNRPITFKNNSSSSVEQLNTAVNNTLSPNIINRSNSLEQLHSDFNKLSREKRAPIPPLIALGAGVAAGASLTAAAMNTASYLSSAQRNSPDERTLEMFKSQAKVLSNVQINQNQLANAIEDIHNKLSFFENQIVGKFEGIAAVALESDLRTLIQHLQTVIQVTLLKYHSAIMAAATTKTSPYVLSQADINTISDSTLKSKGVHISTDLTLIKTFTYIENNRISFIFDIPIIDPRKEFSLFTISYLPSFKEGVTYVPKLDSDHIAINSHGDKYTTFTTNELNRCLDSPPTCISRRPIIPIRDGSSCTALTYITDQIQCHYTETEEAPRPFFLFYDILMFFSVPDKTQIYGKCFKSKLGNQAREDTLKIDGVGQATLQPTCTLTLPDGTTHTTPSRPSNITDMKAPIFSELNNLPQRIDFIIHDNTQLQFQNHKKIQLADLEIPHWKQMMETSFHPASTVSTVTIIVVIIILIVITYIIVYYCCPQQIQRCCCTERIRSMLITQPKRNPQEVIVHGTQEMWFPDTDDVEDYTPKTHTQSFSTHPTIIKNQQPMSYRDLQEMDLNPLKNGPMTVLSSKPNPTVQKY